MMFDEAVEFVLAHEGGYIHDPDDPGGATRYGISQRAYPDLEIGDLTRAQAIEIYWADYWQRCRCDALPERLAGLVFDAAVNQGARASVEMLQTALGTRVDGIIRPETLNAAQRLAGDRETILKLAAERGFRYGRTKHFEKYGRGWMRRLMAGLARALEV